MKRIMILGASILQLPAIIKAKEMGLEVVAVDMDPHAIGFQSADFPLTISTIDIPKVIDAARQFDVDGVMTLASDMPMRTVAAVAKELNLIGISEDTALKATNKALMRECLRQHQVPIPMFFHVAEYENYLDAVREFKGKFIVKPADNSGSRGVYLVEDPQDTAAIKYAFEYSKKYSRGGEIVIEEFMEGPEVSVETLSVNGDVHILAITDKVTTGAPNFVEMGHSQPSCLSNAICDQIKQVATAAVKAIGIDHGPSHTEIIVTKEGPKIVELGARLGGDNITTHLVPLSTGVDMVAACINIALGQQPDLKRKINKGSAICYFATQSGKITSIQGFDDIQHMPGVKQVSFTKSVGDILGEINNSTDRAGFVITQAEDAVQALNVCKEALQKVSFTMER